MTTTRVVARAAPRATPRARARARCRDADSVVVARAVDMTRRASQSRVDRLGARARDGAGGVVRRRRATRRSRGAGIETASIARVDGDVRTRRRARARDDDDGRCGRERRRLFEEDSRVEGARDADGDGTARGTAKASKARDDAVTDGARDVGV